MDHSVLDRQPTLDGPTEAVPGPVVARRRRRRRPVPPAWGCENCATSNAGRRKRCTDCGTSRD